MFYLFYVISGFYRLDQIPNIPSAKSQAFISTTRPINNRKGEYTMAKILEENIVLTISKMVKNTDTGETITLPADFIDNVVEVVAQLLGDDYIVELTGIQ